MKELSILLDWKKCREMNLCFDHIGLITVDIWKYFLIFLLDRLYIYVLHPDEYSEPSQTSKME